MQTSDTAPVSSTRPYRPFLILFAGFAILYLALLPLYPYPGDAVLKVAPILVLVWQATKFAPGPQRLLLLAALIFSGLGDVILTLSTPWAFPAGLGSFLIAQLVYAGLFFRSFTWQATRLFFLLVLLIHASYFATLLMPRAGDLAFAISAYLAAISLMGIASIFYRYNYLVMLGAAIFIVSDTLIAVNKFLLPFAGADLAIMATYYLAQILIFQGVSAPKKPGANPHEN